MGKSVLSIPTATLQEIAADVGTPAYVYDANAIREQYTRLTGAFDDIPHRVFFAVKANSNLSVLRLLHALGAGADIVSGGEFARAKIAGIPAEDVVFSGVGKTSKELLEAVKAHICLINIESWDEAKSLGSIASELGVRANCGIRVNPDVTTDTHPYTQTGEHGMKFGVPSNESVSMAQWITEHPYLELRGMGMHIGSQITNADHYREGVKKLAALFDEITDLGIAGLEWLGVGGGLGIRYTNERALPPAEFADAVRPLHDKTGLKLALEPGRCIVGPAGYLLTQCVYRKRSGSREFLIVDAAMNDLLRPSLYGAAHAIHIVDDSTSNDTDELAEHGRVDVVGPICESGDYLGRDRELGDAAPGDLLVVLGAGAYGFTMSSNYNSRPRAAEVLVDGGGWQVVRERETVEELMRGEVLVEPRSL